MTTVGYGDMAAFGKGDFSMGGVMLTQFFGLLGFSIVKEKVFSSKRLTSIAELVQKAEDDIEETLFQIDKCGDKTFPYDMYDASIESIAVQEKYSICKSFAKNSFWKGLSPQLRERLFKAVLSNV